eukprot:TRINITY_DN11094_c0_g1_i2.p1 TRINITY_DN11094_c0_g1~~TRINITY_DN11094_c0_g1_i2.p1  ORF type:complete len:668 (+),score=139.51 TRINITY_DN11094_c0_g1_i2:219-2222(+)
MDSGLRTHNNPSNTNEQLPSHDLKLPPITTKQDPALIQQQFPPQQTRLSIDFDSMLISLPPPYSSAGPPGGPSFSSPRSSFSTLVSSPGVAISKASPPLSTLVDSTSLSSLLPFSKKQRADESDQQPPQANDTQQSTSTTTSSSSSSPSSPSRSRETTNATSDHNTTSALSRSPSPPPTLAPFASTKLTASASSSSSSASNTTSASGPIYAYQRTKIRRRRAAWQIERPFRCEEQRGCDKTYGSASALRTHVKKKHPDRLFHFDAKNFAWLSAGNKNPPTASSASPTSSTSGSSLLARKSPSPPLPSSSSSSASLPIPSVVPITSSPSPSMNSLLSPVKHVSSPHMSVGSSSSPIALPPRSASFPVDFSMLPNHVNGSSNSTSQLPPLHSQPPPLTATLPLHLPPQPPQVDVHSHPSVGSPPKLLNSRLPLPPQPHDHMKQYQQHHMMNAALPYPFLPPAGQPPLPIPPPELNPSFLNQFYLSAGGALPPYLPPQAMFPTTDLRLSPLSAAVIPALQYPFRQFEADEGQPLFLHCDHFAVVEFNNAKQEIEYFKWHFKGIDGTSILEVQVPFTLVNRIVVEYGVALVKLQVEYTSPIPTKLLIANSDSAIFEKCAALPKKLLLSRILESKRHTLYFSRSIFSEFIFAANRDLRTKALLTISKPNPLL